MSDKVQLTQAILETPFVGPRPFQNTPQDIDRFFGRNREARDITALIIAHRTLLIYGKSGTGKSSLVNAAIIPDLINRGFEVLSPVARVQGIIPDAIDTNAVENIYVFNALAGWSTSAKEIQGLATTTLAEYLRQHPRPTTLDDEPILRVVIFDQFEELFSAYPRHWPNRQQFFEQISDALIADKLLRIIFVMREDYIAELPRFTSLLPDNLRATYQLQSMHREQALLAVTRPLEKTSRSFTEDAAGQLVDELLSVHDALDKQITGRDEFIEPVVLQVVCENLWRSLPQKITTISATDIHQYAQVDNALLNFYEDCISQAAKHSSIKSQKIRDWFENTLITSAGTRGTVFRGAIDTGGIPNNVVAILQAQHIIQGEERAGAHWFELSHDRFIEPIRKSNLLFFQTQRDLSKLFRIPIRIFLIGIASLLILGIAGIALMLIQYTQIATQHQTQIESLANYFPQYKTALILDDNGNTIAELNSRYVGTMQDLSEISPYMVHAVVSLENESYFDSQSWDWLTIGSAFLQNLSGIQVDAPSSTIVQRVTEHLVLKSPANTASLKLQERVISAEISKKYSKEKILELYLNEVYFGNQSYGVDAAAQFYFNVSANELNLPQAAMLAGMIASPVDYNPVRLSGDSDQEYKQRRDETFARMDYVIERMQSVGCLKLQQITKPFCVDTNDVNQSTMPKAQIIAMTFTPRDVKSKHLHFVQFVTQVVERIYGSDVMYRSGFVIKTTLNSAIQDASEAALKQTVATLSNTGINTGSVMVTDPRSGAIKAMVGSPNFNDETISGQVNGALTWQEPGSAIMPIEYIKALEGIDDNGDGISDRWYTPATILWDVPTIFQNPAYIPVNFDMLYHGPVALRYALQNSYNIPAVKTYQFIGDAGFRDMATRLGLLFPNNSPLGLPTALGATEVTLYNMMSAYGTIINSGIRRPLYVVDSITDASGEPIALPVQAQPVKAVEPQIAYLMTNILSDNTASGYTSSANSSITINGIPRNGYVVAKIGMSNNARDLWTMGGTTNTIVGVWLGRPDNNPTTIPDGGYNSAAPLWTRVMTAALQVQGLPNAFPRPSGLIQSQICSDTGTLPSEICSSLRTEIFVQGQEPPSADQAFVQQSAVDTWTGLLANEFCPDNKVKVTVLNIGDSTGLEWLNSPQGATVSQRLGITIDTLTTITTDECSVNTEVPIAHILSPSEGEIITTGPIQIFGTASASQTFNRYQMEYASAAHPTSFTIIGAPSTIPQNNGLLAIWNTQEMPNGEYILRLGMFSNNNGYLYRTINVTIANDIHNSVPPIVQSSFPLIVTETPFAESVAGITSTLTQVAEPNANQTSEIISLPTLLPIKTLNIGISKGLVSFQGGDIWSYAGQKGETISIRVNALSPSNGEKNAIYLTGVLDPILIVRDTSGNVIAVADDIELDIRTDSLIQNLVLENTGYYHIEVRSFAGLTTGDYEIVVESKPSFPTLPFLPIETPDPP